MRHTKLPENPINQKNISIEFPLRKINRILSGIVLQKETDGEAMGLPALTISSCCACVTSQEAVQMMCQDVLENFCY